MTRTMSLAGTTLELAERGHRGRHVLPPAVEPGRGPDGDEEIVAPVGGAVAARKDGIKPTLRLPCRFDRGSSVRQKTAPAWLRLRPARFRLTRTVPDFDRPLVAWKRTPQRDWYSSWSAQRSSEPPRREPFHVQRRDGSAPEPAPGRIAG